jgi:hypothetical protein
VQLAGLSVAPPLQWPMAEPADLLDYSLDYTAPLEDDTDSIAFASIAVAPSGTGELAIFDITVAGAVLTAWLSGGVAGRVYRAAVTVETATGRAIELLAGLTIDPALESLPLAPPPSTGFGVAQTWGAPVVADFSTDGTFDFSIPGNPLVALI